MSKESAQRFVREASGEALAAFREKEIDLRGDTTEESADDIASICRAIALEKVDLLGFKICRTRERSWREGWRKGANHHELQAHRYRDSGGKDLTEELILDAGSCSHCQVQLAIQVGPVTRPLWISSQPLSEAKDLVRSARSSSGDPPLRSG